jgi:chromatin remodeling complex protein RSC6
MVSDSVKVLDLLMAEVSSEKGKRRPGAAFMKPVKPDETLAMIIGAEPIPRTEVTRKMWEYIRTHNRQDPQKRTFVMADDRLKQVFGGRDRVSMFEMTKLVFEHVSSV